MKWLKKIKLLDKLEYLADRQLKYLDRVTDKYLERESELLKRKCDIAEHEYFTTVTAIRRIKKL